VRGVTDEHGAREEVRSARFGQEGGELSYGKYLRVPELLRLQTPLSDPQAHDELLFIVVHQTYELWFRQILFELESVREHLFAADIRSARHYLARVHAIERVMIEQLAVIETMSPQEFLEFRHNLAPASGFQSVQFREIEALSGLQEPGLAVHLGAPPEELARLHRRHAEPTLWHGFCSAMERGGYPMPPDDDAVRRKSLVEMAWSEDKTLWDLSDDLLVHDELFTAWRQRHVLMVERQIGSKSGTGGSAGAPYLRTTLAKRFYPELWDLRSHL
jgi:tryptophan 2,3-dioxygenase